MDDSMADVAIAVMSFSGRFNINGEAYDRVCFGYPERFLRSFLIHCRQFDDNRKMTLFNFSCGLDGILASLTDTPDPVRTIGYWKAIRCNVAQFLSVCYNGEVPLPTKILTAIVHLFPNVFPYLPGGVDFVTYQDMMVMEKVSMDEVEGLDGASRNAAYYAFSSALTLMAAYSQELNLLGQLHSRYKAAIAANEGMSLSENEYKTPLNTVGLKPYDLPGQVVETLGMVVSMSVSRRPDLNASTDQIMVFDEAAVFLGANEWGAALLNQMRMVYNGFHCSTLDFTTEAFLVHKAQNAVSPPELVQEERDLEAAIALSTDRPFIGMHSNQHHMLHVAKFPFWSYVGLLYHRETLDEKDKEHFAKYNFEGVAKHMKRSSDKGKAERKIVLSMPSPSLREAVQAAEIGNKEGLSILLKKMGDGAESVLYQVLMGRQSTCQWFRDQQSVVKRELAKECSKYLDEALKVPYETWTKTKEMQIRFCTDPARKDQLEQEMADTTSYIMGQKAALALQASQVPRNIDPSHQDLVDLVTEMATNCLYKLAHADQPQ